MIYDAFIFFNELELLELRLHELSDKVDYFVLVESPYTFRGNEKELFFDNNKSKFKPFLNKIIHIISDIPNKNPHNDRKQAYENEYHQRNDIYQGLSQASPDDIVIISDADEIPHVNVINIFKENNEVAMAAEQKLYYYYVNCLQSGSWMGSVITKKKHLEEIKTESEKYVPFKLRKLKSGLPKIETGGWHFSYLGGAERIRYKVESFSETWCCNDQTKSLDFLNKKMNAGEDIFNRGWAKKKFVEVDDTYPKYMTSLLKKYPNLVKLRKEK